VAGPERVAGLRIGTRMTVVRLGSGRVWLHSPVPFTPELAREVAALGPVAYLVAPNEVHHLWLGPWAEALPDATLYGAPGLRQKRADLLFHRELEDAPPADWAEDLDQVLVRGIPRMNEVVFLHRASATLLLTDLAMNFPTLPEGFGTRLFVRAMGLSGGLRTSRMVRSLVRDRRAVREGLERVLAWRFDRVVTTHGEILEHGGPAALRAAWRSLLGG